MINQTCPLLIRDLYSYDIVSAYPTILGSQHYDFHGVNLEDKSARSIFLGKQQVNNIDLSDFLMESVDSIVKYYLLENNISDDEVITSQRDGFIIKRMLEINDDFIEMKYRGFIDFLVITPDRKKFLYCIDDKIEVKGVSHYYDALEPVYQMFANLNFYDKCTLFSQMESIKQKFLTCTDKKLFLIPKDEFSFIISTYTGDIEVKDPDFVSINQIDRIRYFNHFVKEFLNSIYLESL